MRLIKKAKGFTLIELMIVVAIIGILAAVAVPKFADLVTKSKEASVKGSLGAVRSAVSIYYGDADGMNPANLFDALAIGTRYMPGIAGIPSLGRYEIPPVGRTLNTGHTDAIYKNASGAGAVQEAILVALSSHDRPLFYVNSAISAGEIYINCTHTDTRGAAWTTY